MKFILKVLLVCTISSSAFAQFKLYPTDKTIELSKQYLEELKNTSIEKRRIAFRSYFSAKEFGLSSSAFGLTWQESNFGELQIGINTNKSWDCGLYGLNSVSSLHKASKERKERNPKAKKIKHNLVNKKWICTKLITNPEYALKHSVEEIELWKKVWTKKHRKENIKDFNLWYHVWGSYRAGHKPDPEYATQIHARILAFNEYIAHYRDEIFLEEKHRWQNSQL